MSRALVLALSALAVAAPVATATERTDQTPEQIRAYKDSGAYDRALAKTYAKATGYVKAQLKKSDVKKPAVVLDIDETAMSNYGCLDAMDFELGGLADCAVNSKSVAIKPALAFYKAVRARKVTVFFITGAPEALCESRAGNLAAQGFTGKLNLTCKPADDHADSVVPYKSGARKKLVKRGYTILANVGDQRSDLQGGAARRTFKLVNPIYVIP
jgi:acid phosphatase